MKNIKKTIVIIFILMTWCITNAQIINNYGIKVGAGLSNQYWEYKNSSFSNLSGWDDYKIGLIGQLYAEKLLGNHFSLRPVLGYIQKGFKDDIKFIMEEDEEIAVKDNKVILHDLSLDLSIKLIPFQKSIKPYILLGLRGDYLIDYRSVIIDFQGKDYELNTGLYDDFNKFTLGCLIGVGISYKDLLFFDFEYNPAISKNFESAGLAIHNRYFDLTVGSSISHLIKDKKE